MAFDALAPTYDQTFTETKVGRWLRGRIHSRLHQHWKAGDHVLELGCGTGEDARHLAGQGIRVTATDASEKMLAIARQKNAQTPLATFAPLDLDALPDDEFLGPFDGAFANFGVLNCLSDWATLAAWLAKRVPVGKKVAFGVMSPYSVWEMMWHGAHLNFRTATRRLRKATPFKLTETLEIPIHYPTPRHLTQDFVPYFKRTHLRGVAVFLPPTSAYQVVEKRPRLLWMLTGLESRLGGRRVFAPLADHYWIEFERVADEAPQD